MPLLIDHLVDAILEDMMRILTDERSGRSWRGRASRT